MSDFDFDHWANLARRDPPAFFRARERVIMRFIDAHPEPQAARLREIQNHIDSLRVVCASPAQATRQLTAMLENHLLVLQDAVQRLLEASNDFSRSLGKSGPS